MGSWQRFRPEVACGLKRGFTFLFHQPGQEFADTDDHQRQLLVAASPHDAIADTHWYRPQFDQALAGEAQRAGAEYLDMTRLECLSHHGDHSILDGEREGRPVRVSARFVIDASGPRGFLHRALHLDEMTMRLQSLAPARKAIVDAGLTPREFAVAQGAWLQSGMSYGLMKQYNLTADSVSKATGVSKANLEFFRANEAELERMGKSMEAQMPKDKPTDEADEASEPADSAE